MSLPTSMTTKYFGMTFDECLTWQDHIRHLKQSCTRKMNVLQRLANIFYGAETSSLISIKVGLHRNANTNVACENDAYVHVGKFEDCSAFAEAAN